MNLLARFCNPQPKNKMNVTITHNGFHGHTTRTVRGVITPAITQNRFGDDVHGFEVSITKFGAKKFTCGMPDCRCGESLGTNFFVPVGRVSGNKVEVKGNYPQR